jgi:uncharacterized protein with ATP-grasp and redox domains
MKKEIRNHPEDWMADMDFFKNSFELELNMAIAKGIMAPSDRPGKEMQFQQWLSALMDFRDAVGENYYDQLTNPEVRHVIYKISKWIIYGSGTKNEAEQERMAEQVAATANRIVRRATQKKSPFDHYLRQFQAAKTIDAKTTALKALIKMALYASAPNIWFSHPEVQANFSEAVSETLSLQRRALKQTLALDSIEDFVKRFLTGKPSHILYFVDDNGDFYYHLLLIQAFLSMNENLSVTIVPKSSRVDRDATVGDVEDQLKFLQLKGLNSFLAKGRARLFDQGPQYAGVDLRNISSSLATEMGRENVAVVGLGQSSVEGLNGFRGPSYLLSYVNSRFHAFMTGLPRGSMYFVRFPGGKFYSNFTDQVYSNGYTFARHNLRTAVTRQDRAMVETNITEFKEVKNLGEGIPIALVVKGVDTPEIIARRQERIDRRLSFEPMRNVYPYSFVQIKPLTSKLEETPALWSIGGTEARGMARRNDITIIAFADRLVIVSTETGKVIKEITNRYFRALHSVEFHPTNPDLVLVSSAGIDRILEVNIKSGKIVHGWLAWGHGYNKSPLGFTLINKRKGLPADFNVMTFRQMSQSLLSGVQIPNLENLAVLVDARRITHPLGPQIIFNSIHPNWVGYNQDGSKFLATFYSKGEAVEIDRKTGTVKVILDKLSHPHGVIKYQDGYLVTDTQKGKVIYLDKDFRTLETFNFTDIPRSEEARTHWGNAEWLQFSQPISNDGLIATVDSYRKIIIVWSPITKDYSIYPYNKNWQIQSILPANSPAISDVVPAREDRAQFAIQQSADWGMRTLWNRGSAEQKGLNDILSQGASLKGAYATVRTSESGRSAKIMVNLYRSRWGLVSPVQVRMEMNNDRIFNLRIDKAKNDWLNSRDVVLAMLLWFRKFFPDKRQLDIALDRELNSRTFFKGIEEELKRENVIGGQDWKFESFKDMDSLSIPLQNLDSGKLASILLATKGDTAQLASVPQDRAMRDEQVRERIARIYQSMHEHKPHFAKSYESDQFDVTQYIGLKVFEKKLKARWGDRIRAEYRKSILLAKERLGGLAADFFMVDEDTVVQEEGKNLRDLLEEAGRKGDFEEVKKWLGELFEFNEQMLQRGVINWDLKLDSFVVIDGNVRLADIGALVAVEHAEDVDAYDAFVLLNKDVPSSIREVFQRNLESRKLSGATLEEAYLRAKKQWENGKKTAHPVNGLKLLNRLSQELNIPDEAMASHTILKRHEGGIDLTPANMHLKTKMDSRFRGNDKEAAGNDSEGSGIKFHLDPAQLAQLQDAPGFVPVIINIEPLDDLKRFLGIPASQV